MIKRTRRPLSSDDFMTGFLAALAALGRTDIAATRSELHQAFLAAIQDPTVAAFVDREELEIDYDPLYGTSPWLDRALTQAQSDLLVEFPNPTYHRVKIKLDTREAEEELAEVGDGDQFSRLAEAFWSALPKHS